MQIMPPVHNHFKAFWNVESDKGVGDADDKSSKSNPQQAPLPMYYYNRPPDMPPACPPEQIGNNTISNSSSFCGSTGRIEYYPNQFNALMSNPSPHAIAAAIDLNLTLQQQQQQQKQKQQQQGCGAAGLAQQLQLQQQQYQSLMLQLPPLAEAKVAASVATASAAQPPVAATTTPAAALGTTEYSVFDKNKTSNKHNKSNITASKNRRKKKPPTVATPSPTPMLQQQQQVATTTATPFNAILPKPKRPRTAYNLFFKDTQKDLNLDDRRQNKASKVVSDRWQHVSASVRLKYHQMAAIDKVRYYNEKNTYEQQMQQGKQQSSSISSHQEQPQRETNSIEQLFSQGSSQKQQREPQEQFANTRSFFQEAGTTKASSTDNDVSSTRGEHYDNSPVMVGCNNNSDIQNSTLNDSDQQKEQLQPDCWVPPFSSTSMAHLASRLDPQSIDFIIRALK